LINAVFQDFVTNTEAQNLRKTKQSALLAREKYEADKVLEVGNKIKELNTLLNEKFSSHLETFSMSNVETIW
jgi:hypothetical protein